MASRALGALLLVALVSSAYSSEWDHSESWTESDELNGKQDILVEHNFVEHDDADDISQNLAAHAIMGAMQSAGVRKDVVDQALAQMSAKTKTPTPTKCTQYAIGEDISEEVECTEGNVAQCVTSRMVIEMETRHPITGQTAVTSRTVETSDCDKMQLCTGMEKKYYTIEDGHCGKLPTKDDGSHEFYCSRHTPENGKIPDNVECKIVKIEEPEEDEDKDKAEDEDKDEGKGEDENKGEDRDKSEESGAGPLIANTGVLFAAALLALVYSR